MINFKRVWPILALAVIFVFAWLPSLHAGAGLGDLFPVEPDAQGSIKTKADFTLYGEPTGNPESDCSTGDYEVTFYFFIKIITFN